MALQVWLPLNGNLKNNGLAKITTVNTPTFLNNGKLGNCLSLNPRVTFNGLPRLDNFTIAFWLRTDSCTSDWADNIGFKSVQLDGSSASDFRFEATVSTRSCSFHNNTPYAITKASRILVTEDQKGKWHHCAVSYNGTKLYTYVDGVLKYTDDGLGGYLIDRFHIGQANNIITGGMNDLRIYDECLSTKQIKEISKGLAAHYKFNWIGRENMLLGTEGIVFSRSGAVDGGVSSKAFSYPTFDVSSLIGKKMTISVDIEAKNVIANEENGYHRAGAEISLRRTNGTTYIGAWQSFTTTSSSVKKRLVKTGVIPEGWDGTFSERNMYIQRLASGDVKLSNLKVEIGDNATPWTLNSADPGYEITVNKDVSGYKFDGQIKNTVSYFEDSPKYNFSTDFLTNGSLHYLTSPLNANTDAFTYSLWFYPTRNSTMALYNDRLSTGDGFSLFYMNGSLRFDTGSSYQWQINSAIPTLNSWNHIVITFDKNNGKKCYLNGELKGTTESAGTLANIGTYASIGSSSSNGAANGENQVYGYISDARIYITELSEEDIKDLYNISAEIDNYQNTYSYEFIEEGENIAWGNYPIGHSNYGGAVFSRTIIDDENTPSKKALKLECTTDGKGFYISSDPWTTAKTKMIPGKKYVLSMLVKANTQRNIKMDVECASSQSKTTFAIDTEYKRITNIFTYSSTTTYSAITNYSDYISGEIVYIGDISIDEYNENEEIDKQGKIISNRLIEYKNAKIYKHLMESNDFIEK